VGVGRGDGLRDSTAATALDDGDASGAWPTPDPATAITTAATITRMTPATRASNRRIERGMSPFLRVGQIHRSESKPMGSAQGSGGASLISLTSQARSCRG
jgi:hypothetical protein